MARRCLGWLIAALAPLLFGWLSVLTPSSGVAIPADSAAAIYGYAGPHAPDQFVDTNSGCGPPSAHDHTATVDTRSHGAYARLDDATCRPTTTYAIRAGFARGAETTAKTR